MREMEFEQPLLTLRPKFLPVVTLLSQIPAQIFVTIWAAGCGAMCVIFAPFAFPVIPSWLQPSDGTESLTGYRLAFIAPIVIFALLFFFGVPLVGYLRKRRVYAKTEYRFFRNSLEYYEGFFTVERKTINYQAITEITVREGPIQRMYGLGSLVLSTAATGTQTGASRSGIILADLEEPEKVYRQVRELMPMHRST